MGSLPTVFKEVHTCTLSFIGSITKYMYTYTCIHMCEPMNHSFLEGSAGNW